jgi:hypothetical protein
LSLKDSNRDAADGEVSRQMASNLDLLQASFDKFQFDLGKTQERIAAYYETLNENIIENLIKLNNNENIEAELNINRDILTNKTKERLMIVLSKREQVNSYKSYYSANILRDKFKPSQSSFTTVNLIGKLKRKTDVLSLVKYLPFYQYDVEVFTCGS